MGQILLVRHGQASWDAEDYDVLSETGWKQARVLGHSLADRGITVDTVVRGRMRRHRETAEGLLEGLSLERDIEVDDGWDEFDHLAVLARVPAPFEGQEPSPEEFHRWFLEATARWTDGQHDEEYAETWTAFTGRVGAALDRAAARDGATVVVTSGGPIAWSAATLLADRSDVRTSLWHRLNAVCLNTGVTRLVTGRRGLTLVTLNEHPHLDPRPELLTYR
ncbi:MAG: histidine phosphatase family protein [Marmoricola sp.]|nr:histidine phosphatase family protein [Marmoricola sp.]